MQYAIAYMDSTGKGFSPSEPFVLDGIDSLIAAEENRKQMVLDGYKNVIIFGCTKDFPEYISWPYVTAHEVTEQIR